MSSINKERREKGDRWAKELDPLSHPAALAVTSDSRASSTGRRQDEAATKAGANTITPSGAQAIGGHARIGHIQFLGAAGVEL